MTWYAKGTFSNPAGSAVITGTGTEFATAKVRAGDGFIISNEVYEIKTVDSETQLTLVEAVATANTNATYSIIPITGAVNSGAYIEGEVVKAVTNALRRDETYLIAFSDMLYNPTPAMVDVRLPDGTVISVPNWALATRAANTQDWADALKVDLTAIKVSVENSQKDVNQKQQDVTQKATNAADSATLASKWAENPEDSAVVPGKFSALHHAAKAAKSATQADTDAQATAADRVATGADRVQTGKDVVAADGFAADAKKSAGEAAQYDPTKSFVYHGLIPVTDNINDYAPDVAHRGVWYATGGTVALGYPLEGFTGPVEVFTVDSSGVQRATHQDGQVYFRWYQTVAYGSWIPMALGGVNSTITGLTALAGSLRLGADGSNPADATTLRQMQQAIAAVSSSGGINGVMSTFIGDVSWWAGDATLLPTGYVMPSGQLDKRSDYPEVWALIDAGVLRSTTEASWNDANATARGVFTKGTITSGANANFRWPDLNGGVSGSIGGLFLRGPNGPSDAGAIGVTRVNAAPNIKGLSAYTYQNDGNKPVRLFDIATGGFTLTNPDNRARWPVNLSANTNPTTDTSPYQLEFDASRTQSPNSAANAAYGRNGATEVRPNSVSGYWIMRAKGTFSAQTNFGVFVGDAAAPGNGVTKNGGLVRSVYQVANKDYATAELRAQVAGGATPKRFAAIDVGDDTGAKAIWGFGDTGDLVVPGNSLLVGRPVDFTTVTSARQSLTNMGLTVNDDAAGGTINLPISATQVVRIRSGSSVVTTGADGIANIVFGTSTPFATAPKVFVSNGDSRQGMLTLGADIASTVSVNVKASLGTTPAQQTLRVNWIAIGTVNA